MCLLVAAVGMRADFPLVVLANRDEFYARPAVAASVVETAPRVWAPQDEVQGGTWLGLNEHGVFVGLTNGPNESADPQRRSRGLLCRDLLRLTSSDQVRQHLLRKGGGYNAYRVLAADRDGGILAVASGGEPKDAIPKVWEVERGVHVLTNLHDPGTWSPVGIERVTEQVGEASIEALLEGLTQMAADHQTTGEPSFSPCKHREDRGTRSSAVVAVGRDIGSSIWLEAEGPPCQTPFRSRRDLFTVRETEPRGT